MKKLFLFLAIASTTMFVSCGSDDSDSNTTPSGPTSITLTSSVATVEVGQTATLTVKDNTGAVVTGSTFTITPATGASVTTAGVFTATAAGSYSVVAKSGTLTSAALVITVTAAPVVANNSIVVENEAFATDLSTLYYLGTTQAGINVFVANSYNMVGTGEAATYPNDIYVYFTSQQTSTETLDLPVAGGYTFGTNESSMKVIDANIIVGDDEILATEVTTNATFNLSAIAATEAAQNWTYTYTVTLENGSVVNGHFSGDWNFQNASQPAARNVQTKAIKKVSNAQIAANLKAVMAKKAK